MDCDTNNNVYLNELLYAIEVGTWDWELRTGKVRYSDAWGKVLGYTSAELPPTVETWERMVLPEDLPHANALIQQHLSGETSEYEAEFRMVCKDGAVVWVQDRGRVTEYDEDGKPLRLMGILQNVTRLKNALEELEHYRLHLESEIASRTKELVEQDNSLRTVNKISKLLLVSHDGGNFEDMVQKCLQILGENTRKNRVYIWKDQIEENGDICCNILYEWVSGVEEIRCNPNLMQVSYEQLPTFAAAIREDRCLNSFVRDLTQSEQRILCPAAVKTILIVPITISGKRWGFIGVDNCESEALFSSTEENMLLMSGSMLANAIERTETDASLREVEERTQLMLNATPLCCNLWTKELQNMCCNDEAVRLFELSSQQEYLDRFEELSPQYQPCGRLSSEYAVECIHEAFRDGYKRMEWMHQKLDGTPIPAEITLVRVKYKDSFIVTGYTRDLREQKAMLAQLQSKEDDLRTARDEALLNSKAKTNFLANMSHEIRTPMNAITGLAEIILRESTDEKTAEYAKGIKDASANLLNIINDILDISKIESGKLEIFHSQYELSSLLNDVITISRARLGEKPLMFITNIDSRLPARLLGDEIRVKQILINLLSNAIKFTQEGYLALRVSGTLEGDRAILRFSVKDSGVGIKQEDLERLFAEFERVNTTKNRNIEGTGLGLAISKQLCEMMGGRIEVKSEYGRGSEFIVTIPQECPSYERLAQVRGRKKVLLYEPRELYRNSICETMEDLECICVSCENQSELYDNISLMQYDYILTASLHIKKVRSIVGQNKLTAPIAVFAEYIEPKGMGKETEKIYTILFPINCLQLADLLNNRYEDADFMRRSSADTHFTAPSARILLVDDNPVNLRVGAALMAPYKFKIDTAVNGREAVEKVQQTQYDLVFMDHMMPEMDGIDATVAIRALNGTFYQTLPIIALTANALVGTREMFIREGMNDFLAKPIETNKLCHILAKWLPKNKIVSSAPPEESDTEEKTLSWEISGLNTAQGIMSVGGSKEIYLQILAAYYSDGEKKCSSLLRHVTEKNISAFRTEVHALKSASAVIGAIELSTMAAKLEKAAHNGDILFINDNLDDFLTALHKILQAIRVHLPEEKSFVKPETSTNKLMCSDSKLLKESLNALRDAVEFANIGQIEAVMEQLKRLDTPEAVTQELENIRELSAVFDYDGMLECVDRLMLKEFCV